MLHGLIAERGAVGWEAVLQAFVSEDASSLLVYRHETSCELSILEQAIVVTIQALEYEITVFLSRRDVKFAQSYM